MALRTRVIRIETKGPVLASTVVEGSMAAQSIACKLVHDSAWFSMEPLPDDFWEITTKDEASAVRVLESWHGDLCWWLLNHTGQTLSSSTAANVECCREAVVERAKAWSQSGIPGCCPLHRMRYVIRDDEGYEVESDEVVSLPLTTGPAHIDPLPTIMPGTFRPTKGE